MIITNGKILYYFFCNSRDMIIGETATEDALIECIEMVGGDEAKRKHTNMTIRGMMKIYYGVEVY